MSDTPTPAPTDEGFDPGEPFTPTIAAAADKEAKKATTVADEPPLLTVDGMKKMLINASRQAHTFAGDRAHADLTMTDLEAGLIAPGLVKYANSRPLVRATFGGNEYLKLGAGTMLYGFRIANERSENLDKLDEAAGVKKTEAPAPVFTEVVDRDTLAQHAPAQAPIIKAG